MKSLIIICTAIYIFSIDLSAQRVHIAVDHSRNLSCIWQASYINLDKICYRKDHTVSIKPRSKEAIKSIELFLGNKSMGKDSNFPFSWTINPKSNKLYAGTHRAKAKVIDICGTEHWVTKSFRIIKCNY